MGRPKIARKSTAIDMTVASKKQDDKAAIVKSSKRALQRLESIRAKEKTELQAKERAERAEIRADKK